MKHPAVAKNSLPNLIKGSERNAELGWGLQGQPIPGKVSLQSESTETSEQLCFLRLVVPPPWALTLSDASSPSSSAILQTNLTATKP